MNYYISNPYLPTHQIQNTQITPTNTSHILLKYSPCHWASTNILYTQAHKLSQALSQILPIITHILSNLDFHKICSSYPHQNWAANYTHQMHSFPPFNLEVIVANCPTTTGVALLGYYWLTEAVQLGLQIIQR